jgi:ferrous iron transport protein B
MSDKILLMGNPNVGKSIFFTEMTGIHAISGNYAGTTVTFLTGKLTIGEREFSLIDAPGTYSLEPSSEAEGVAASLLEEGAAAVICVLDATNLQRNLQLAIELRARAIPTVYALNLCDIAQRKGIAIDTAKLEAELGAPVVETIAVKGQGFDGLLAALDRLLSADASPTPQQLEDRWEAARRITRHVSRVHADKPSRADRLGAAMVRPWPGIGIAAIVLAALVGVVVFGGRMLRMPLIMLTDGLIIPFFRWAFEGVFAFFAADGAAMSYRYLFYDGGFQTGLRIFENGAWSSIEYMYGAAAVGAASVFLNVLSGEYGIFVISFQWIIALILPYVFAFYIAITFLEDSGYLPRVSVLFDSLMRKLGVQGGSLIHIFLALGCAVPAILGSRTATTRKEKKMIAAVVCFAIPCISQIAALSALMGAAAWWMPLAMLTFGMLMFIIVALVAGKIIKGKTDPLIIEVPNLLMPNLKTYLRKLWIRMRHFLKDAEFPMLIAVFIAAVLAGTGVLMTIAQNAQVQAVVSGWLGMPEEAVVALILGIVRREMSVAPLLILNLSYLQIFVAGVVSLLYLPCLSVFGILAKEFKIRFAVAIFLGTITTAILVGGIVNHIGQFIFT